MSKFYNDCLKAAKSVQVNFTKVEYSPAKKSAVKRGDNIKTLESGFLLLATNSTGKDTLAAKVSDMDAIKALKPLFATMNRNRAILAVYACQTAWGTKAIISEATFKAADDTVAALEKAFADYERRFASDKEFRAAEIAKKTERENARHDKAMKKIEAL